MTLGCCLDTAAPLPHLDVGGGVPAEVLLQGSLAAAHQPLQERQRVLLTQAAATSLTGGPLPQLQAFQAHGLLLPVGGKFGSKSFQAAFQRVYPGQNALLSLAGRGGKSHRGEGAMTMVLSEDKRKRTPDVPKCEHMLGLGSGWSPCPAGERAHQQEMGAVSVLTAKRGVHWATWGLSGLGPNKKHTGAG